MSIFTGSAVAIVTPFKKDGSVDYDKFRDVIEYQIAGGTDCIVVCGTTGESSTLSHEEHLDCIRFCAEVVNKRIPVVAGTGSNCNRDSYLSVSGSRKVWRGWSACCNTVLQQGNTERSDRTLHSRCKQRDTSNYNVQRTKQNRYEHPAGGQPYIWLRM